MLMLRQSTAVDILIGPFVDKTDGATAETGESPSVKLSKAGQTLAAKNEGTTPTHDADGYYNCVIDATDTGTLGLLTVTVAASASALPVRHEYMVVVAETYDALVSDTDKLPVNLVQITGDPQSATDLKDFADAGYDPATNKVQGVVLADTVATLSGHTAQTGDTFALANGAAGFVAIDNVVDGIQTDLSNSTDGLGALKTDINANLAVLSNITLRLPTALVNGRMDSTIDDTGMETGAVDAILTRQMTESYAANGTAPTLAQAQFAIHQMLMQFGISGTSYTVRQLDDSTTAFIVTLDSASAPTDASRT